MSNLSSLRQVSLFGELSEEDLEELESIIQERFFRKNEVIFRAQEPGSTLFVLKRGSVKVSAEDQRGKEVILRILKDGDFFGEMSLLDGQHRSATVTALEPCQALVLFRDQFLEFIPKHPNVVMKMLTTISRRLRQSNEKIKRLVFADAYEKVASILIDMSEERQIPLAAGAEIPLSLTRKELADLVGLSRETLTRVLSDFQRAGLVRLERRRIAVINPARVRREAKSFNPA